MAIFEFLGVETPHEQQILAEFRKFKILKKILYLCANFRSNMVFVEMYLLLDYNRYALIDVVNAWSEVGLIKVYVVFILISRLSALITPN